MSPAIYLDKPGPYAIIDPEMHDNRIRRRGAGIGRLRLYPIKILTLTPDLDNASVGNRTDTIDFMCAPDQGALFWLVCG